MRRKDREIKEFETMLHILKSCDCCRIGLIDTDSAYIVPVNFGYEVLDGSLNLYFHSASEGKKIDLLQRQKKVSFEMDTKHVLVEGMEACQYSYRYQCIMGKGILHRIEDEAGKIHGFNQIMSHYTSKNDWDFEQELISMATVLKLEVTEWSCKEH